jgi:hypothetical protein
MTTQGVPLRVDYYNYVDCSPEELADEELVTYYSPIQRHMSYFEKEQLLHSKLIVNWLEELHVKLDVLLSQEQRDGLSKVLKHMPPNRNPYLFPE